MPVPARSVSDDKNAGIPISRQEYPVGLAGVKLSLTEIAKRIREGSRTPSIRSMAGHIIQASGAGMNVRARGQAILDYVREKVVYAYDPEMTEMTASAPILLCVEGAPLCMPIGDCDDACVAIGSLMGAAGMTVRVAKLVISEGAQEHVLIEVYDDESGEWLGADFSEFNSRNYPLGWEPPHVSKQTMDPMHPDVTRISGWGKHEAEFIGVGSARGGRMKAGEIRWDIFNHRWVGAAVDASLGLGAAADVANIPVDPYALADTHLANQVAAVVAAGDRYFTATPPEYTAAITAYQAAGQAGAGTVGPEIDRVGNSAVTQPLTQQAWLLNRSLALLSNTGSNADAAEATTAQSQAKQMVALYNQAIAAGRAAKGAPPASAQATSAGTGLLAVLAAGAALGVTWELLKGRPVRRRSRR